MKATIERAILLKSLGHVQSVVERRDTIPILSNVLLSADGDRVTLSATDLDMEIIDESQAGVAGQRSVLSAVVLVVAYNPFQIAIDEVLRQVRRKLGLRSSRSSRSSRASS